MTSGPTFTWSGAAEAALAAMSPAANPKPESPQAKGQRRAVVLVINLDSDGVFGKQLNGYPYNRIFRAISDKARILSATSAGQAMDLLRGRTADDGGGGGGGSSFPPLRPDAIYIPDPLIAKEENRKLAELVAQCCLRDGARVILGSLFAIEIEPAALDGFMEKVWQLPWRTGELIETSVYLNDSTHGPPTFKASDNAKEATKDENATKTGSTGSTTTTTTTTKSTDSTSMCPNFRCGTSIFSGFHNPEPWKYRLKDEITLKAVFLRGVPRGARWYVTTDRSIVTSRGKLEYWQENRPGGGKGLGRVVENQTQTPVACMRYGEGWLCYTGDEAQENETNDVIMSMLGLNF